jgi:hypothetical protein
MLSLYCPNCYREIGTQEAGKEPVYFYKNDKGEPICPTCDTGENHAGALFLGTIIAIVVIITLAIIFI